VANFPPVSTTPAANFATIFASVVDTGGKFATGVNDTCGKFATGVNDAGGKLPLVSTTPAANCHRYQRYMPVANCHWCQRRRWQIATGINDTGGKFATSINDTGSKLPPVSTIPPANLPPVSTTPVANNGNSIRLQIPESELEGKNVYIYANSATQRCPNKIIKIFLIEDFFHLPPVSLILVVHLEPRISPQIFEKIRNARNDILRCLGETDS
jgi:hypothetical protein